MRRDEAWERAEKETTEQHGKWSAWQPTLAVSFIGGMIVVSCFSLFGNDTLSEHRLMGFIVLALGASSWLIERSLLKARSATFNRLYDQYRDRMKRH